MKDRIKQIVNRLSGNAGVERRPWDFPEMMLLEYLRKADRPHTCFVVGAHHGLEVRRLLDTKSVERIVLFEAEPTNAAVLRQNVSRWADKTEVVEAAVCDYDGTCTFHEMNLPGNGSVLEPSALAVESYGTKEIRSIQVKAIKLDSFVADRGLLPDVLWIDVQGAEIGVLRGSDECLKKAGLVFIEVSTWAPTYAGGCITSELTLHLERFGFRQTQLGTDLLNGTGNALFVKQDTMTLRSMNARSGER